MHTRQLKDPSLFLSHRVGHRADLNESETHHIGGHSGPPYSSLGCPGFVAILYLPWLRDNRHLRLKLLKQRYIDKNL